MPTLALMRLHTERVALDLTVRRALLDWSGWWVRVYDKNGRVALAKMFTEGRDYRPSAQD
ncbi:hypothetical protein ACLBWX_01210 [Methylobacterium sp. M6A4_1b]